MPDVPSRPEEVDLTADERADIDGMYLRLASGTLYEVLGVAPTADRRALRDAYFGLSKRFHPDAFFGRRLGPWQARLEAVFREITHAYDVLSNRRQREAYDATLGARGAAPGAASAPDPAPGPSATGPEVAAPPVAPTSPSAPAGLLRNEDGAVIPPPLCAAGAPPSPAATTALEAARALPKLDPEAGRRAAREALARKLGGGGVPARPGGSAPRVPDAPPATPLQSLEIARAVKQASERQARVDELVRAADEALERKDLAGASHHLALAASLAPDDAALRARADEVAREHFASTVDRHIEQARFEERARNWRAAATNWEKAWRGRPHDAALLERAAHALLRGNVDLRRAAELARRATQVDPSSVKSYITLAQIFLAAGLRASAASAIEAASKLDPASSDVKELQQKARG